MSIVYQALKGLQDRQVDEGRPTAAPQRFRGRPKKAADRRRLQILATGCFALLLCFAAGSLVGPTHADRMQSADGYQGPLYKGAVRYRSEPVEETARENSGLRSGPKNEVPFHPTVASAGQGSTMGAPGRAIVDNGTPTVQEPSKSPAPPAGSSETGPVKAPSAPLPPTDQVKVSLATVRPVPRNPAPVPTKVTGNAALASDNENSPGPNVGMGSPGPDIKNETVSDTVHRIRIASKLHHAFQRMDEPGIQTAINQMTVLKGKDSHYINNVKAFWLIKQKKYDEARSYLHTVLAKSPRNLAAGLNMAVIETYTHQSSKAKRRLRELLEIYPDEPRLHAMLDGMAD